MSKVENKAHGKQITHLEFGRRVDRDPFFQWKTIYGVDGEHTDPYMTRVIVGQYRLHIFHKGDNDPDPHDHPFDFTTFPLTSYVEEVVFPVRSGFGYREYIKVLQIVPAFRRSRRKAEHTHRVLGRWSGERRRYAEWHDGKPLYDTVPTVAPAREVCVVDEWGGQPGGTRRRLIRPIKWHYEYRPRKVVTLVWTSKPRRRWGFLKKRDGRWCWQHWKEYLYEGGKNAPCG